MLDDAKMLDDEYKADQERSWGTHFVSGGVEFATSLFWQSLQNQDAPLAEIIESSQGVLEGADLYCIKKGKTPQFGICVSADGYKPGQNAGAITLSSALSDQPSFVAVFKVPNGWWYVCVRDDVILANGDMLYLSEEDAKKQFMSMLMVPDWKLKIAPPEWNIEDTLYPDLDDLLSRGSKVKLQKINTKGKMFYIIAGAGAFIVLYILYQLFMSLFDTTPTVPVMVPVAPKVVKTEEIPPEPKPWENLPDPIMVMGSCQDKIMDLVTIMPPGWKIGNLTCTTGGASTTWSRLFGRISIADKALNTSGLNFSARSISDDGNTVMAALSLGNINTETSEPTRSMMDLKINLNEFFQSIDQKVALNDEVYTSPQQNVYRSVKFKFSSNYNPKVWSNLLTKFSGLTINLIMYNPETGVWEYEGAIYAL